MSSDSAEVAEDYRLALEDLSSNMRFEISNLTVIARENTEHALAIAEALQQHILKAPPNKKLPALYVLDSIVKNVGTPYTLYFGRTLFKTFMESYAVVDQPVRRKMEEMLRTWKEPVPGSMDSRPVFTHELVRPIENALMRARAASMPQQGIMPGRARSAMPHRDTPTPPGMRGNGAPQGYPAQQYPPQNGNSPFPGQQDIQNLIVATKAEFSHNPHDASVQNRLRALLDLQGIVQSTSLPPDQLELIKNKVTELAAVNMRGLSAQNSTPTPATVPPQAPPAPPVAVTPSPAPAAPAMGSVTLDSLLGQGALAALMARQSATPQNATPTPTPPYANVAIRSPPPTHMEPPKPAAAPAPSPAPAAPAQASNPLALLDQLRLAGMLPAATPPAAPVAPPPAFDIAPGKGVNAAALKQPFHPSLLSRLYDELGPPCTQCGRRFKTDEEGRKKKTAHMDWHFRVHQRSNEAEKRGMHRSWYVDQHDWVKSREVVDADHIPAPDEASAQAVKAAAEAAKPKYIPVPEPSKGINTVCPICQDRFENKWLDTAQEWVWLDAVLVGNRAYHASCHAEATQDRESTPGITRPPESLLGKRKADTSMSSPKLTLGRMHCWRAVFLTMISFEKGRILEDLHVARPIQRPCASVDHHPNPPPDEAIMAVDCPICNKPVKPSEINSHIDSGCTSFIFDKDKDPTPPQSQTPQATGSQKRSASTFFSTPAPKRQVAPDGRVVTTPINGALQPVIGKKRTFEEGPGAVFGTGLRVKLEATAEERGGESTTPSAVRKEQDADGRVVKKTKTQRSAPLAERMRPRTLDQVCGQELVGPNGVLRSLIESNRVPSMILWGASGTGKTTIARCIANMVGSRFIELNATSTGVGEVKKLFQEAINDAALTGRKTIIFCDEIHRFNKAQQDVFLKPVEDGTVTLIGATTENPSFKVANALLSRCRTFTLQALTTEDVVRILKRALEEEASVYPPTPLLDDAMVSYLARFSDGDARTALNLLELALSLTTREGITQEDIKASLTKTLVYDRAGDQHYDTISAFHKSVRGNDPDAALYYLARMLQSGEDPLFIARRMVVIASEDVGLADNTLLPLATAAYTATQQIGMPEARIPLAHCAVALCAANKSTRAYRGLNNAYAALREPGVASLPVPLHLRNAPTRLMRDLGYGAEYKYPPNYRDGLVRQTYLPDELVGRTFLEERDLGTEVDPDMAMGGT
ncbi:DNA replication ATPase [Ilyonectria destructans]|nr:DNA replication ATPase [Ilyonectria destructans]